MHIPIQRVTIAKWNSVVSKLGKEAQFIGIPGVMPDGTFPSVSTFFKGVYADSGKTKILVGWPVDRPEEHQKEFADKHTFGSYPPQMFDRPTSNRLSVVKDVE